MFLFVIMVDADQGNYRLLLLLASENERGSHDGVQEYQSEPLSGRIIVSECDGIIYLRLLPYVGPRRLVIRP